MALQLTDKQAKFIAEYPIDFNGTQAAIRAGYSKKTAYSIANELLNKPEVQSLLSERAIKVLAKADIEQDAVLRELSKLVFSDYRKLITEDGALLPIKDWPDDIAGAVASLEINETLTDGAVIGYTKKVKFWDKNAALEKAMKYLNLIKPDQNNIQIVNASLNWDENKLESARRIAFVLAMASGKIIE